MTVGSGGAAPGDRIRPAMPHMKAFSNAWAGFLPSSPAGCHHNRRGARRLSLADDGRARMGPLWIESSFLPFLHDADHGTSGMMKIASLTGRAVLAIAGEDRIAFLQGLVS